MRMRHHLRFIFVAEMRRAWAGFGGLVAQLNHLALLLSIASLETAGYAMRYHEMLVTTLADFARARYPIDFHLALSEIHDDTRKALLMENTAVNGRFPNASSISENTQRFPKGKSRSKGKAKGKGTAQKGKKGPKRCGANAVALGKGANYTARISAPNNAPYTGAYPDMTKTCDGN